MKFRWCSVLILDLGAGSEPSRLEKDHEGKELAKVKAELFLVYPAASAAPGGCGAGSELQVPLGQAVPRTTASALSCQSPC